MNNYRNYTTEEIKAILEEYNKLFNSLNKETYYNLITSKKLLNEGKKQYKDENALRKAMKLNIYTLKVTLESIMEKIEIFMEEQDE